MRRFILPVIISLTAIYGQAQAPEFDYKKAVKIDLQGYKPTGSKLQSKGRKISIGKVSFVSLKMEERGHWVKYYLNQIGDHPDDFQPQFKEALKQLMELKGFEVVPDIMPNVSLVLMFDDVLPQGHRSENGETWLFNTVKTIQLKGSASLGWDSGRISMDGLGISDTLTGIPVSVSVTPSIGGGLKSLMMAYPGSELVKFPGFVAAANQASKELLTRALDIFGQKLDEERLDDIWRRMGGKM